MKARRVSATAAVLLQSLLTLPALSLALTTQISAEEKPIVIGLDADFTGSAPQSGMAIERGMLLAIDEINAAGGVIGRPLTLKSMDDRGVPARGADNIDRFLEMDDLVALVGGLHSPVMLAQTRKANEEELILFSAWAAATPIVDNGHDPNTVFRVSVRDEYAGLFLVDAARARGFQRPGLLLWQSGWGRSNEESMTVAAKMLGLNLAGIEWFNITETDFTDEIDRLAKAGADVIMLVANPDEGIGLVQTMAAREPEKRLPIISHWGITGTDFHSIDPKALSAVDLTFLQTFSFWNPPFPEKADAVYRAYCAQFVHCKSVSDVISPTGTAHGYDIVHLIAKAVEKAGTIDRPAVRDALENLDRHEGLVRVYDPPFSPDDHEALSIEDYSLARFNDSGAIEPVMLEQIR